MTGKLAFSWVFFKEIIMINNTLFFSVKASSTCEEINLITILEEY